MKQTIRENCFETNSSSYHTLTIQKIQDEPIRKEIQKGQDLSINNGDIIKIQLSEYSYKSIARSTYEKAQLILRFIAYEVEEQIDELIDKKEYKNVNGTYNWDIYTKLTKEQFYNAPLIQAFVKAIKRFIGQEYNVNIIFTKDYSPYIEGVSDEAKYFEELFNLSSKEDKNDVEKMTEIFYNIIFDPEIEIIEECEGND